MVVSPKGSEAEEALVERAGKPVADFVRARWKEDVWETAWFVNPPVRPSALDLMTFWLTDFYRDFRAS